LASVALESSVRPSQLLSLLSQTSDAPGFTAASPSSQSVASATVARGQLAGSGAEVGVAVAVAVVVGVVGGGGGESTLSSGVGEAVAVVVGAVADLHAPGLTPRRRRRSPCCR
jgi:hypothetical protein